MGRECFFEGCSKPAPYGLALPGLRSERRVKGCLWHCRDHEEEAMKRRDAKMVELGMKRGEAA